MKNSINYLILIYFLFEILIIINYNRRTGEKPSEEHNNKIKLTKKN